MVSRLGSVVLILAMGASSILKVLGFRQWKEDLRLLGVLETPFRVSFIIPILEFGLSAGLIFPRSRRRSALIASHAISIFSGWLLVSRLRNGAKPCGCFGPKLRNQGIVMQLMRNSLLLLASFLVWAKK